jgi:RNA polymerase sigma-70 factor (ECF subfamily)
MRIGSVPREDRLHESPALAALNDEELVARAIGGDTESFNQLIKRWERPIYALAFRTLGREEDARDASQETFLRAFRALPGFKGESKFSSWLYRIALNICRDFMRRERRAPFVPTPEGVDLVELAGEGAVEPVDEVVGRRRLGEAVARAMELLPEEQRTAVVLKEYEGLTFQEIADLVGCPLSTVKTRLYQGLTVLRRELERNGIVGMDAGRRDEARRPGRARAV